MKTLKIRSAKGATKKNFTNLALLNEGTNKTGRGVRFNVLFLVISLLSFIACEGQVKTIHVDPEGCDTIFIESPVIQKCVDDLAEATSIIVAKTAQVASLETEVISLNGIIENKDAEIQINLNVIDGINQDNSIQADVIAAKDVVIERRDATIVNLEAELAIKPDTIYNTEIVYVEKDSISVGGKDYKISEIEIIVPKQSIDTIYLNTCYAQDDQNKVWYHSGDINIYPHVINFPTKELSMTNIMFNEELTEDMKKYQTKFTIKRVKNHEDATTKYINVPVDPSEYLPQN